MRSLGWPLLGALWGCGGEVVLAQDGGDDSSIEAGAGGAGGEASNGTAGSTTGVGGDSLACAPAPAVYGCVLAPQPPGTTATYSGSHFGVYEGPPPPGCGSATTVTIPAHVPPPAIVTKMYLKLDNGEDLLFALATPGLSKATIPEGPLTLQVTHLAAPSFGHPTGTIALFSGDSLVALVGQNDAAPLTISEGDEACYREGLCGVGRRAMRVDLDGWIVDIPPGQSAGVGGLVITNGAFDRFYDTGVGCDFAEATMYRVGVARLLIE